MSVTLAGGACSFALCSALLTPYLARAQQRPPFLIPAGAESGLPLVEANDNTVPAGSVLAGVREISLEVVRADWRLETDHSPGLRVAAVAEEGGPPQIPSPLIRVEEGTRLRVRVRNALDDSVSVFGLHERTGQKAPPLSLAPGATRTVEFEAGAPGTYLYHVWEGPHRDPDAPPSEFREREQLAGAFVVDPAGGSPPDRVMVMNIFSTPVDENDVEGDWYEGLAINGKSWPYTERMKLEVGKTERWRVVNASVRLHPMHLHGFFYEVLSRGTESSDTIYPPESRRTVVTEPMLGARTMLMEWTPTRPGAWLFHCHLSFHVTNAIRLPGAVEADPPNAHSHMAGLVMGIEVAPGPTDLIVHGEPEKVDLYANEYGEREGFRFGFATDPDFRADSTTDAPGPLLTFHQYEVADVTVWNRMSVPTGIHWHGLELDAWADGVPGWSRSDGRSSPVIGPGEDFTYRLSFQRPGTFIYHTHLDDVHQLTGGLYGPLVVLPEGESFDTTRDHTLTWQWRNQRGFAREDVELNGRWDQPEGHARVGERHRFRLINISPAGYITAWITRDGVRVPYRLLAKDGADLPEHQQVMVNNLARIGAGETADFTWTPTEPGVYELMVGPRPDLPERSLVQRWVVEASEER